jgi:flavin-dependent dehydrogenase
VPESPTGHATVLHFPEPEIDDLVWAWEIPLNDGEISVGVVMSASRSSDLRAEGLGPREIFERQLAALPRLRRVVSEHSDADLRATTYTPFLHPRTVGENWLLVGDAAAMVDPLTSNGVTSALRYARQAADVVSGALDRDQLDRRRAQAFQRTTSGVVATLDRAIEAFVYEPTIRNRLGLRWAVNLYAATGVITNSLYAKLNPNGPVRSNACAAMLAASRTWTRGASTAFRRFGRDRATRAAPTKGEPVGARR